MIAAGHVEATCRRCFGPNVSWTAPSPLWNLVMRGGGIGGTDLFDGIVCPTCFVTLAEEGRLAQRWYLSADRVLAPLQTVLADGRVWNETARLWLPPEPPSWQLVAPHRAPDRVVTQLARDAAGWQELPPAGAERDHMWSLVRRAASAIWAEAFHAGAAFQRSLIPPTIRCEAAQVAALPAPTVLPAPIRNDSAEGVDRCGLADGG